MQELVDLGVLDEVEARSWPRRNVVTRALGASDRPELEIVDGPVHQGDRFLLCSDGLTAHLADAEIASMLGSDDPQRACDDLLALTLRRGASDNVSLIVVDSLASSDDVESLGRFRKRSVNNGLRRGKGGNFGRGGRRRRNGRDTSEYGVAWRKRSRG